MNPTLKLLPWQLWVVDFSARIGDEQAGVRPAIVVGSARHCSFRTDMTLVIPLTTRDRGLRHHVRLIWGAPAELGTYRRNHVRFNAEIWSVAYRYGQSGGDCRAMHVAAGNGRVLRGNKVAELTGHP